MQTKKDIVNERLLDAARVEFMEKGYEKASIRSIVKNAETTIGNFYNYYKSKEAIFTELVEGAYNALVFYINNHNELGDESDITEMDNTNTLRKKIAVSTKPLVSFIDDKFVLLLDKSQGTKYENSRQELIDVLKIHFEEHLEETPDYKLTKMGEVIAVQLVAGMVNIISITDNDDEREKLLVELILYSIIGVFGLLGIDMK